MKVDLAMLIDDSEVDLFIQKRFIEISGFAKSIKAYSSPLHAITYLQESDSPTPQVIFLDLNMPDMDGFGFLDKFVQLPDKVRDIVKVVVLTSSSNQQDKRKAEAYAPVTNFLSKPLSVDALKALSEQMG